MNPLDQLKELGITPGLLWKVMNGKIAWTELFNGKFAVKMNEMISGFIQNLPKEPGEFEIGIILRQQDGKSFIVICAFSQIEAPGMPYDGSLYISRVIQSIEFEKLGDFIQQLMTKKGIKLIEKKTE